MIEDLYRKGVTISEMARISGHSRTTVRAIVNGPVRTPLPVQVLDQELHPQLAQALYGWNGRSHVPAQVLQELAH